MPRPKNAIEKITKTLRFSKDGWLLIENYCKNKGIEYSTFIENTVTNTIQNKEIIIQNIKKENTYKFNDIFEKKIKFRQRLRKKLFRYFHKIKWRIDEIKPVVLQDLKEELKYAVKNDFLSNDIEWLQTQIKLIENDRFDDVDLDKTRNAKLSLKSSLIALNLPEKERDFVEHMVSKLTEK